MTTLDQIRLGTEAKRLREFSKLLRQAGCHVLASRLCALAADVEADIANPRRAIRPGVTV